MSLIKMMAILRNKDYKICKRPYELNIVGLRSKSIIPNQFDDEIHVFYKTDNLKWNYRVFKATTDPGTYWLKQPMQPQGTAILEQGQYPDAYELGMHRGQYTALVQSGPVNILRDYNRDAILDFNNGQRIRGRFGINIHRANKSGETLQVDKNSAGCQVFKDAEDFRVFIELCNKHRQLYGNRFTYTLVDFRAVRRQNLRYLAGLLGVAGLTVAGIYAYKHRDMIAQTVNQIKQFFQSNTKQNNYEQNDQTNPAPAPTG